MIDCPENHDDGDDHDDDDHKCDDRKCGDDDHDDDDHDDDDHDADKNLLSDWKQPEHRDTALGVSWRRRRGGGAGIRVSAKILQEKYLNAYFVRETNRNLGKESFVICFIS